jgi:hypothetical protein
MFLVSLLSGIIDTVVSELVLFLFQSNDCFNLVHIDFKDTQGHFTSSNVFKVKVDLHTINSEVRAYSSYLLLCIIYHSHTNIIHILHSVVHTVLQIRAGMEVFLHPHHTSSAVPATGGLFDQTNDCPISPVVLRAVVGPHSASWPHLFQ